MKTQSCLRWPILALLLLLVLAPHLLAQPAGFQSRGSQTATNANSVPLNAWTHVAVSISSNKLVNYYINGSPAGSWDGAGLDFCFTSTVQLAANNGFRAFVAQAHALERAEARHTRSAIG